MEQVKRERAHLERVLIVAGLQNAGKSTQLRRMFSDWRFGTRGAVPTAKRLGFVSLSGERCLFFRLTSPHEREESLEKFFKKLDRAMERAWKFYWRFNFACALQPLANATTPDVLAFCQEFKTRLLPERIRVAQIHPRQDGTDGTLLPPNEIDALWELGVEVMILDGRRYLGPTDPSPNGLMLADYFDFT